MQFIAQTNQKVDTNSKSVEQIGKREDSKFPSTITVNPSHSQRPIKEHQVNAIGVLRSGKKVGNKVSYFSNVHVDDKSDVELIIDEK